MSKQYDYDFIVVGSGFGGSVSAMRLTEKGYSVAVLEMGKRFQQDDFAKTTWDAKRYFWNPKLGLHGILQMTKLKHVFVAHGAGVGGGSLVYANTLITPKSRVFQEGNWPTEEDWEAKLAPFYAEARRMLGVVEAPRLYPTDLLLRDVVHEETGRGDTFHRHTVGVYFGEAGITVPDPFFGGEGPDRTGCIECGACMVGCRHGAKNTLDKNYLYFAEKKGAIIFPETKVTDIRPLPGGGYEVHTESSTARFRKQPRTFTARGVVMSASVLGTVELLAKCKQRGSLPKISDRLGDYVRTNSEAILGVTSYKKDINYGEGIAITSGIYSDEHTHIEAVRYGETADSMATLQTMLTGAGAPWPRWLRLMGNIVRQPVQFLHSLNPFGWAKRTAIILVMQPLDNHLRLRLKKGLTGKYKIDTELAPGQEVPSYMPQANHITKKLAEKMHGYPQSGVVEVLANTCTTAHILGGAIMGRTPEEGVCDEKGRVFGYENLYVADGSVVPANLGVNPSLTITALSEYIMSCVPEKN
jgi:cholesterol oxidase